MAVALVVPAACGGSTLKPDQVVSANNQAAGIANSSGGGGSTTPTGDGSTVTDPGAGTVNDPGASTGGGSTGGGSTGGGSTGGGSTGGGSTGGGSTGGGSTGGGSTAPAGTGVKAGSCTGFKNGTGITDSTITIGNSSDLSGPVPGLFTGAQQATRAYMNYFNSTSSICGRKLALVTDDSRTDAGADQAAYTKMCDKVFATVGSMSAFDSGGARTAQACGLPDIRAAAVTGARNDCSTCFGVQATGRDGEYSNGVYDFWVKREKAATQKAAFLYLNAGAAAENGKSQIAVGKKRGMNWIYTSPIDVAEFNYGPYVQQMKSKGVEFVQFLGAYQQSVRMAQAMQSAGFKPKVLMYDPSVYDPGFLKSGGSAVEGAYMFINFLPLDSNQPEMNLYRKWLQQVSPGAQPTFFGLFAWSAMKLFVEKSIALGGKLNRASLIAAIRPISNWTGGGAHGPMEVGTKHAPSCIRYMQVQGGKFVPFGGTSYLCAGQTKP
ncbi:ABC transporter substrate-binding protein [Marmoricola sp. RAF53]|uniref:ABC transporter substrate-binding protein n=1 Tax=Marmoricola sp. RAF53 TaxID=3233059 RepID=UPI003F978C2F